MASYKTRVSSFNVKSLKKMKTYFDNFLSVFDMTEGNKSNLVNLRKVPVEFNVNSDYGDGSISFKNYIDFVDFIILAAKLPSAIQRKEYGTIVKFVRLLYKKKYISSFVVKKDWLDDSNSKIGNAKHAVIINFTNGAEMKFKSLSACGKFLQAWNELALTAR